MSRLRLMKLQKARRPYIALPSFPLLPLPYHLGTEEAAGLRAPQGEAVPGGVPYGETRQTPRQGSSRKLREHNAGFASWRKEIINALNMMPDDRLTNQAPKLMIFLANQTISRG